MKKELLCKIERIAVRAVKKAQQENHRKGLPIVYTKNGKIYFELPNGSITTINPFSA
ncbi:MAG: hypothetical protein WC614_09535 [bacterium]